jgi:hypothetical protein
MVFVSAPIFQLLLGLSSWKWLLWVAFAFKLSRRDLKLVPTHPDEHGGLGFLSLTPAAFAPIAFAASAVLSNLGYTPPSWRPEDFPPNCSRGDRCFRRAWAVGLFVRLTALRRKGILNTESSASYTVLTSRKMILSRRSRR